jgi:proline racemase
MNNGVTETPGPGSVTSVEVVDSHTEGEPTRVVIEGWPPPVGETMAERRDDLLRRHGRLRRAAVCEPRGHDAVVGALLTPPVAPGADARSFVLCPGLAWDRSPCGTGTSAKMAVLAARGRLNPGQRWRQESLTGGLFEGWLEKRGADLVPHVRGRAFVTGRTTLLFDPRDPLRAGFSAIR